MAESSRSRSLVAQATGPLSPAVIITQGSGLQPTNVLHLQRLKVERLHVEDKLAVPARGHDHALIRREIKPRQRFRVMGSRLGLAGLPTSHVEIGDFCHALLRPGLFPPPGADGNRLDVMASVLAQHNVRLCNERLEIFLVVCVVSRGGGGKGGEGGKEGGE